MPLFDASTGIYVNALMEGIDWERPTSLELIYPDGSEGFQVEAGLRIRGGWSRHDGCPKHAFRLFFRSDHGDSKLEYDLFEGEESAEEFDKMDLRTAQNYSWSFKGDDSNTFMRDVFSRDLQRQMGQPYTRSRFYHLYINGQYWGLYMTQERSEAAYAASYFGGDKDDYDTVKADGGPTGTKMVEATDGTLEQFSILWSLGNDFDDADLAGKAVLYNRMLGLNPDGTPNSNYPVYLDPDNLIDMMLNVYYVGERDAPISAFFGNDELNNWYGVYNRNNPDGFKYFRHDGEHSMDKGYSDRTGPFTVLNEKVSPSHFNPQTLHQWLMDYPEYNMRFADRAYQHMFNDGAMTEAATKAQLDLRAAQIEMAIIAESARWGDAKTSTPLTKADWVGAVETTRNWLTGRVSTVISHLRNKNWYPSIDPPTFYINSIPQRGGMINVGDEFSMYAPAGTIYYTFDGSDPRLPSGQVNPDALSTTSSPTTDQVLITKGATWKYLDDGSDQGTGWRALLFDDTAWASGPAELGYGDGGEGTIVGYGDDANNKYPTTYFRHVFNLSNPAQVTNLSALLMRDDGAIVYLNGTEIIRDGMLAGDVTYLTHSSATVSGGDESTYFPTTGIDTSLLVAGDNVIAVEIHQKSYTSSDISFDFELAATVSGNTITPLNHSTHVKSRVLNNGGIWSALNQATYGVGDVAGSLRISEIMYHPATDPNSEFIELTNVGAETINLNLAEFANGIDFVFSAIDLDPAGHVVVVRNLDAFNTAYPDFDGVIAGQYDGSLDNDGDRLLLQDAIGTVIHDFKFKDGWYDITDGGGFTLTIRDAGADISLWDDKDGWRPSALPGGSPGIDDSLLLPPAGAIVINEVLAHSHALAPDWIELHNTTTEAINIGGWFLSDSDDGDPNIMKYEIPADTIIAGGGYKVFYEDVHFGNPAVANIPFALSEGGDEVFLRSGIGGVVTGYEDKEDFKASESGVAFGRYYKASTDTYNFVAMSENTPNEENAAPKVGPIVISEIMYRPDTESGDTYDNDEYEYIELRNITGSAVPLQEHDALMGIDVPWKFTEGIDYTFPLGTIVPAGGRIVVAKNLEAYAERYGSSAGIFGPFVDSGLSNSGEAVDLSKPGDQEDDERYYIRVDRVKYSDGSHPDGEIPDPWPTAPDGDGDSLDRIDDFAYGNDYINWQAATPSPGS